MSSRGIVMWVIGAPFDAQAPLPLVHGTDVDGPVELDQPSEHGDHERSTAELEKSRASWVPGAPEQQPRRRRSCCRLRTNGAMQSRCARRDLAALRDSHLRRIISPPNR